VTLPEPQREIGAFLARLTGAAAVETHISAVYVGEAAAYKLKKAIRLSFLDFSAPRTRRDMARREMVLNSVAAPGIYRGVQAIRRDRAGALCLGDADAPDALDYVVEMAPIPPGDFIDVIAARAGLSPALLDGLGDCVAALHEKLPPVRGWDSAAHLQAIAEGNALAARQSGLDDTLVVQWLTAIRAAIEAIAPQLAARAAAGFVRRAHGDLHLGNLCLWQGKPVAFDMLEFDDALATIDIGYDVAFLLMDVEHHAGRAAANRLMNRYLARTGDVALLVGMPVFLSMRALIRAFVQAARGVAADAGRYLQTALAVLQPAPARLVAIGGLQGTGKTTLARGLAPQLGRAPGALHLRSDEVRKRQHGVRPEAKLPQSAYSPGANARVNAAVLDAAGVALRAGQAVVADTTFLHHPLRRGIEAVARDAAVPFTGLWLEVDLPTALGRVSTRMGDASDAGPEVVRAAAAIDPGPISWPRIDAADGAATLVRARAEIAGLPVHARSALGGAPPHSTGDAARSPDDEPDHG
jgi:aminoglycoside phosphotransferase family enzyme/predicted kinase